MSTDLTKPIPKRISDALDVFEHEVGGRDTLVHKLTSINTNPEMEYVIGLLADPRNEGKNLAQICQLGGITLGNLLKYYRECQGMQAQIAAIDKVYNKLPLVAEDVMVRALPSKVPCSTCKGTGEKRVKVEGAENDEYTTISCWQCQGEGKLVKEASLEHQKLALQMGKILINTPQVAIDNSKTLNQQNNVYSQDDLKTFRSASDKLLYPGRTRDRSIKVEVIKEEESETIDATYTIRDEQ